MLPRLVSGLFLFFSFCILTFFIPAARADTVVTFNEIMYHPQTNEPALEWIELYNEMAVDIDLSGWSLNGGIEFKFAEGTIIPGGGYMVIAVSPSTLAAATGLTNILGPFTGRLANAGEQLELRDNNKRLMDSVTYGVEGDWPAAPDGSGVSLAKKSSFGASKDASNWSASAQIGGTPGTENFPIVPPPVIETVLIPAEGNWKFNDTGSDLGSAWRDPAYIDSAWPGGSGLFFQEDAPLAAAKNTPLAPGRTTYYFRSQFTFSGDASRTQLRIRPIIDDGAVFYLNGIEILRLNMPSGPVTYSTPANANVADATFGNTIQLPSDHLLPGANVLAVEVHQASMVPRAYPRAVLDSAPVGYWRLDETNSPAIDSASAAAPPQSGAQNGIYSGLALTNFAQPGPRPSDVVSNQPLAGFEPNNAAARFSGNNDAGNDVVRIPDGITLNFASTRVYSLEAWVNGSGPQEEGAAIIAKGTGGGGEQFAIDLVSGNYRFFNWDGAGNAVVAQSAVAPNGTWQHVVGVLDQPAGRMELYVNGTPVISAVPRPALVNTIHEVSIGARKGSPSAPYDLNFNGRIDEVAIYDRALTANEIRAHFNAAFDGSTASGPDTNDVVFGAQIISAETLPSEPLKLAFNEHSSSTNSAFWLEIINYGSNAADIAGCAIARFGGLTNREFVLPSQTLPPGALLQVTKATMGFGADSGDLLVLYGPGKTNVLDAFIAKKDPRARHPDAIGPWWFQAQPSPGESNIFAFHDEIVINEIMYNHRPVAATPPVYSPTNMLLTVSNAWRYHAQGMDLGAAWRARDYDDTSWPQSNAVFYAPTNFFNLPAPKNTFVPLTNSSGSRITTFYFRTQFMFNGDTNALLLGLRSIVDDGAVFYINGAEVARYGMPAGNITYSTLAISNINIPTFYGPLIVSGANVVIGMNVLAVEVHQITAVSSDMDFGAELLAWNELVPAFPFHDSPESWVELFNRSSNTVDLTGWRLDEGIDYRFAPGKILGPGSYLVVARDVDYLRSLYPSIDIVGPFTNKLSKSSDLIVLKDANNNPADEVRYFDGGRWPELADASGSSLELRDPHADNSIPEAWAASNESPKSLWQTYTYRGVAQTPISGSPNSWNEFDLGLIDGAGELLLDDISVIESPTNAPVQLVQNGSFSDGGNHWRFLGNHRHSRVESDSDSPGNSVLHLIATGPTEYQGNQIETTYVPGRTVVDGRTYEISFRAKWLAGASQLNTRLYFTRLARTTQLAVPPLNGTPGARNSAFTPNIGPLYNDLRHDPIVPASDEPVTISVQASDPDGIASMTLNYSIDGASWQSIPMLGGVSVPASLYRAVIPPQPPSTLVQFYIEGHDTLGAVSTFPASGPNSRALYRVNDGQGVNGRLQNFRVLMLPQEADFLHAQTNVLSNELLGGTVIYDEGRAGVPVSQVFYDVGVRLKGSFVGRDVPRVGFTVNFHSDQLFRGVHDKVAIDRSQHAIIGQGEIISKHIASHAGGIPNMYDDLIQFIAPRAQDTSKGQLRMAAFDENYLDSQFRDGSDGSMYEFEVFRFSSATAGNGGPEGIKIPGAGYANLDIADYGDDKEAYRWLFLLVNNRVRDDYSRIIPMAKAFSLTSTNLDLRTQELMDVDEWLRAFAYESLLGVGDAYYTGANHHNLRLYVRPEDQKVLAMPWDWDSSYFNAAGAPLVGGANLAKIVNLPNNLRAYYGHLYDLITTTFNSAYMTRWTQHYGTLAGQDFSTILAYIQARASFVMGALPTTTAFSITSNAGNDFSTGTNAVTLIGTAPIQVKTIQVNGTPYNLTWTGTTAWTLRLMLNDPTNRLTLRGFDNAGNLLSNALDTITITVTNPLPPSAIVFINEWMAANNSTSGFPDPADGDFDDWFELYNPGATAVDLTGYYLTDDLTNRFQFTVPRGYSVPAGGFLLVWADGETSQNSSNRLDLHVNFKLNQQGEAIGLFAPNGSLMDSVVFTNQIANMSRGRYPDAATNLYFMPAPTPRAPNQIPASTPPLFIAVSLGAEVTLILQTTPGRQYQLEYKNDLDASGWQPLGSPQVSLGSTLSFTDDLGVTSQRFYRVVQTE